MKIDTHMSTSEAIKYVCIGFFAFYTLALSVMGVLFIFNKAAIIPAFTVIP